MEPTYKIANGVGHWPSYKYLTSFVNEFNHKIRGPHEWISAYKILTFVNEFNDNKIAPLRDFYCCK